MSPSTDVATERSTCPWRPSDPKGLLGALLPFLDSAGA
jgi:hypothetical protein